MSDVQKIDGSGGLDLNFAVDGEEKSEGYVQVDLHMQAQQKSFPVNADFKYQNPILSYHKSHSVATVVDQDDTRRTKFDYDQERTQSSYNDYDQERTQSRNQGEMDELPGSYFNKSSYEFKAQTFHRESGTEDSADSQESPLSEDSNQIEETEGNSNIDRQNTTPRDEKVKDTLLRKSCYEFGKSSYNEIVEGDGTEDQAGKFSSHSRPPLVDCAVEQKNAKYNSYRNSAAEGRKLDMPPSTSHSDGSCHRKSASPIAVKQMFVSPEGSPHVHLSPDGRRPLSLQEDVQERLLSHSPCRQKHSSTCKRSDLAKRISPHDHLSPSATQTTYSPKRSQQGSRDKDCSSLKRLAASPGPHYSPKRYGRSNRPVSRSPIQRRVPVSGYRRDYQDRSRSRSPHTRDQYRSPRRRYSPRRRSPGDHRRRPSPRRRPWSPPPNRRTGLGKPGKNLFVAGFSFLTTERDLERKFSRFGRVRDVRIVRDKRSGDSRGFGFLSLERDEDADEAIRALDETEWNDRIILVEKSKSTR